MGCKIRLLRWSLGRGGFGYGGLQVIFTPPSQLRQAAHPFERGSLPRMEKGTHPLLSAVCQIQYMRCLLGGTGQGNGVGLGHRGNSSRWIRQWTPRPPFPLSVSSGRALLGGREALSAALPHLGPNVHSGIVLASGDRGGGWGGSRERYSRCRELGKEWWLWPQGWASHGTRLMVGGGREVDKWRDGGEHVCGKGK